MSQRQLLFQVPSNLRCNCSSIMCVVFLQPHRYFFIILESGNMFLNSLVKSLLAPNYPGGEEVNLKGIEKEILNPNTKKAVTSNSIPAKVRKETFDICSPVLQQI